jgi:hypothetical protein
MVNPEIGAPTLDVDINFNGRQNGYKPRSAKTVLEEKPAEATFPTAKSQAEN